MIVDHISNWRRYGFGPAWEQMMCWLENYAPGGSGSLAGLKDGTHPLADGFVNVATLTSRPLSGSLYECHKRFCDVQMVVEGQEWLFNLTPSGVLARSPTTFPSSFPRNSVVEVCHKNFTPSCKAA